MAQQPAWKGRGKGRGKASAPMGRPAGAASLPERLRERRLIEAAQRDPRRFGELYEEHFERVYAFVARRVGNREQAEDLTADVFHDALRSLPRYQWRGAPFAAWLFRIAANAIIDRGKRAGMNEAAMRAQTPTHARSSEAVAEEAERRGRLLRLVNKLPRAQRRVIIMRFAEQRTIGEIATESGRSEGAVKQLQFRALKSLRAMMG